MYSNVIVYSPFVPCITIKVDNNEQIVFTIYSNNNDYRHCILTIQQY